MAGKGTNLEIVGVGVDLEEVHSFREKSMEKDARFFSRLFSDEEMRYCQKHRDPAPFFTARFCAKEALVKAARKVVDIQVTESQVEKEEGGAPFLQPRSKREEVLRFFQEHDVHLSLSHTKDLATAFVVVVSKDTKQ